MDSRLLRKVTLCTISLALVAGSRDAVLAQAPVQGYGIVNRYLIMSDGTNRIRFLNPTSSSLTMPPEARRRSHSATGKKERGR
jgi:hypothetical protein